jgi:hypothetical protein
VLNEYNGSVSEYVLSQWYEGEVLSSRDSVKCEIEKTAGAGIDQRSMWNSSVEQRGAQY